MKLEISYGFVHFFFSFSDRFIMFSFSCLNSSLFISINKFWESCCSVVFMPQSLNPPHLVIYRLLVIACQTGRRNNGQEQAVVHHKLIWKGLWEVVGPPAWIVSNPFSTAAAPTLLKHRCLLIFFFITAHRIVSCQQVINLAN